MKHRISDKLLILIPLIILISASFLNVSAEEISNNSDTQTEEYIQQLYQEIGADKLMFYIPEESKEFLSKIKIEDFKPNSSENMSVGDLFGGLAYILKENIYEPLRILVCVIGIILITAMFDTLKSSSLSGSLDTTLTVVSSLCMIAVVSPTMLSLIDVLSETIVNASNFMLMYVPVISVLIITSGQPLSGTMFYGVMVYMSNAILQIASKIIIPLLKCIISMSIVTSVSNKISLDGIINLFKKTIRWILTFCMSIFVAFMTMKSIVTVSEDSLSNRAVKFAISNFVPLVGGALSDAYQTVAGCVTVLKSGVGVVAMVAVFAIFLPSVAKCMIWQLVIAVSVSVSEVFGIQKTASLLGALSAVISVISAILLCTMVMYIISTAIIIIVGG